MRRTLLLLPLLLCSCSQEPTISDAIDAMIVIKAADEYNLMYFYVHTESIKPDIYHTDYIGYDEYHTYYSLEYLTATRDNEILQTVQLNIFINPLYN